MYRSHNIFLTLLFEEMYGDKLFSGEYEVLNGIVKIFQITKSVKFIRTYELH